MAHYHMRRSVISTGSLEITWKAGNLEVICRHAFIAVWCNLCRSIRKEWNPSIACVAYRQSTENLKSYMQRQWSFVFFKADVLPCQPAYLAKPQTCEAGCLSLWVYPSRQAVEGIPYPFPRYQRLVVFPEIASWQTSKGEVIRVSEIRDVIIPENRICTLEQAEVYYEGGGKFYWRNEKAGKCKK